MARNCYKLENGTRKIKIIKNKILPLFFHVEGNGLITKKRNLTENRISFFSLSPQVISHFDQLLLCYLPYMMFASMNEAGFFFFAFMFFVYWNVLQSSIVLIITISNAVSCLASIKRDVKNMYHLLRQKKYKRIFFNCIFQQATLSLYIVV